MTDNRNDQPDFKFILLLVLFVALFMIMVWLVQAIAIGNGVYVWDW